MTSRLMKASEDAVQYFSSGLNCAESTLKAMSEALGVDSPCIPRIATGLGAGLARYGDVCGAMSGAILALGLVHGRNSAEDTEAKEAMYAMVRQLQKAFEDEFGSIRCRDLTGCDLTTSEGLEEFKRRDVHAKLCVKFVSAAVREALQLTL